MYKISEFLIPGLLKDDLADLNTWAYPVFKKYNNKP